MEDNISLRFKLFLQTILKIKYWAQNIRNHIKKTAKRKKERKRKERKKEHNINSPKGNIGIGNV